jgi:hypothetical protein
MRITGVEATDLFGGSAVRPLQIIRVTLVNDGPAPIRDPSAQVVVRVAGAAVSTGEPAVVAAPAAGAEQTVEVGVRMAAPAPPGAARPVVAVAEWAEGRAEALAEVTASEPGWTMWMVSHFHYDPVWWNTQGQFLQTRLLLPDQAGRMPDARTAFELVRLHLDAARADPDYKFVLAELDYLKPHFDAHPEDRRDLLQFIAAGRIELVGASYNEPNTNLTCAESTIRNVVYGTAFQREVLGGNPSSAWMLDAFGFDPAYPGLMAAAGLAESAWARGPFHQWGPARTAGDNRLMQFASEFEWLAPDGTGLLTSYMANHYSAGWVTHQAADLAAAERAAYQQFRELAPVAATRNVLLPVGADHVIPSRWATEIHRDWNARYVWPRFVMALPAEFFAAVRADATARDVWITPQTRDMNPVYPGKDVSYIDTKQAQRAAETAVLDGERLATLAWLAGARYPAASLDKAWRLLVYGAHHDAITGTEGDQVYLDLLAGWREAYERGDAARRAAAGQLAALADTDSAAAALARPAGDSAEPAADSAEPAGDSAEPAADSAEPAADSAEPAADSAEPAGGLAQPAGDGPAAVAIVVVNSLSPARSAMATLTLTFPVDGPRWDWLALCDDAGAAVAFLAEGVTRHSGGGLAAVTVTFRAAGVPAMGYRTYLALPSAGPAAGPGWRPAAGCTIENEHFAVTADPARGGTLSAVRAKRAGTELLAGPGNELILQDEYPAHPRWGEGPWLLCPKGPGTGSARRPALVRAERCPVGSRLVTELTLGGLAVTAETLLWDGADRVEFRTHVDGSIGQDRLLRVAFPASVPGGLPVYQTAVSAVGRPFGAADADVADHPFTLDNPAHEWFGLGSTARVALTGPAGAGLGGVRRLRAIGVAEVVAGPAPGGGQERPGTTQPGTTQPGTTQPGTGRPSATTGPVGSRAAVRTLITALARCGVTATCSRPDGPRYGAIEVDSNLPDFRIALGGPGMGACRARQAAGVRPRCRPARPPGPAGADRGGRRPGRGDRRAG